MDPNTHVYCTECIYGEKLLEWEKTQKICQQCFPLNPEDSFPYEKRPQYVPESMVRFLKKYNNLAKQRKEIGKKMDKKEKEFNDEFGVFLARIKMNPSQSDLIIDTLTEESPLLFHLWLILKKGNF